jgi:small subunit ribosomal protein S16
VIEELGYYDPMVGETDARAILRGERIDYWLGVGAQPTEKVAVLIKKYGTNGTHAVAQEAALQRLAAKKPTAPPPMVVPQPKPAEETVAAEAAPATEAPAEPASDSAPSDSASSESGSSESGSSESAASKGEEAVTGDGAAEEATDGDKS